MDKSAILNLAMVEGLGETRCVCPFCSHERKNKRARDLSLTVYEDRAVYMCHHCGEADAVSLKEKTTYKRKPQMSVAKQLETKDIGPELSAYLLDVRKISPETAARAGCIETRSWFSRLRKEAPAIAFGYFNKGKVYSHKLRAYPDKDFSANGAPQTLFNAHNITDWSEIMLVEGEFDCLAALEAGLHNTMSIPNGALNMKPDPDRENGKLRFLKHHSDDLAKSKKVIICTDADDGGETMADEIARRIGRDRCWRSVMPEGCKDANDVLIKHGPEAVKKLWTDAKPWPIEGLHDADHFFNQVMDAWDKGLARGENTGLSGLDFYYSVVPGQLSIVTGHPSNGKSELVDQLMVSLAESKGWKFAISSFENEPRLHISNLISKYIGLPFFTGIDGRMTIQQRDAGMRFVKNHFAFLFNDADDLTSLDSILERLRVAVLRHGIKGCVIDPYNYIAKPKDKAETEWVSEMLSRVRKFAQSHGIHVWFVAHPTKMQRGADGSLAVPKGNDISGSAAWWAKADFGITVHRPDPEFSNKSEVHIWKCRYSWCGKQGKATVNYNTVAQRYVMEGDIVRPKVFT